MFLSEFFQSDMTVFAIAMLGIAVSSVAILRDYLPRQERGLDLAEPIALPTVRDRAA